MSLGTAAPAPKHRYAQTAWLVIGGFVVLLIGYALLMLAPPATSRGHAVLTAEACTALRAFEPPVSAEALPGGLCKVEYLADGPTRITVAPGVLVQLSQVVAIQPGEGVKK